MCAGLELKLHGSVGGALAARALTVGAVVMRSRSYSRSNRSCMGRMGQVSRGEIPPEPAE